MKRIRSVLLMILCCLWLSIGNSTQTFAAQFSEVDERLAANSLNETLEYNRSGVVSTWRNPDAQISGRSQPLKTFQTADGTYCREFQETVTIAGRQTDAYGTACRQDDGHWKIIGADRRTTAPVVRVSSQVVKKNYPSAAYRSSYAPVLRYPIYFVFGYSIYDDHHRSHYRSGKHRSHSHQHGYSHRGKNQFRGWSQKHEWFDDRAWNGHRGHGRGGGDWRKGLYYK